MSSQVVLHESKCDEADSVTASIIASKALSLCPVCAAYEFRQVRHDSLLSESLLSLGPVRDIQLRSTCPLCRLVLEIISTWTPTRAYEGDARYLDIYCILRPLLSSSSFIVQTGATQRGKIRVYFNLERHGRELVQQSLLDEDQISSTQLDFRKLSELLYTGKDRSSAKSTAMHDTGPSIMLIDVQHNCLVRDAHVGFRYAALSYVRGGVQVLETLTSNIDTLCQADSLALLWRHLPRVVQDAMILVRNVSIRYLWVDSLCIVQNDADSKHTQISSMYEIYEHAFFTIAVLSSPNAHYNIPGVRPNTRSPLRRVQFMERGRPVNRPFALVREPPDLEALLADMPYETRGWTFQERLLSRRCLYLSTQQAFFYAEKSGLHSPSDSDHPLRPRGDHARNVMDIETTGNIENLSFLIKAATYGPSRGSWWNPVSSTVQKQVYRLVVMTYTRRCFSFETDILSALSGVNAKLERDFKTSFVSGLPLGHLGFALTWLPAARELRRRQARALLASNGIAVPFPSWSWSGWVGPVQYDERIISDSGIYCRCVSLAASMSIDGRFGSFASPYEPPPSDSISLDAIELDTVTTPTAGLNLDRSRYLAVEEYPSSDIVDVRGDKVGVLLDFRSTASGCFTDGEHLLIRLDQQIYYETTIMLVRKVWHEQYMERVAIGKVVSSRWDALASSTTRKRKIYLI